MAKKIDTPDTVKLFSLGYRSKDIADPKHPMTALHPNSWEQGVIEWEGLHYWVTSKPAAAAVTRHKENHVWYTWAVLTHRFESAALKERIDAFTSWRDRERKRLADGTYRPLPESWQKAIAQTRWADIHFAHISSKDPYRIAYTPSEADGARDRQVSVSPSLYLYRHFDPCNSATGDLYLNQNEQEDLCSEYRRELGISAELGFARTGDEIEDVYRNGPRSCMSHSASQYEGDVHPVQVYGDSDLQLAYIKNVGGPSRPARDEDYDDEDEEGRGEYSARCLVWPAQKVYGRMYGHASELRSLLEAQGYKRRESFIGARFRAIPAYGTDGGDEYIMPYVDVAPTVSLTPCGEWWQIDRGGELYPHETCGVISHNGRVSWCCERCDHDQRDDDDRYEVSGQSWCQSCTDDSAVYISSVGEYFDVDSSDVAMVEAGSHRHEWVLAEDTFECDHDGKTYHIDDLASPEDKDGNTVYVAEQNLTAWCEENLEPPLDDEEEAEAAEAA